MVTRVKPRRDKKAEGEVVGQRRAARITSILKDFRRGEHRGGRDTQHRQHRAGRILDPEADLLALLTKRDLAALLNVNVWSIDRWRKTDPNFPSPVWISGTTPRWRRIEIENWIATRPRGGRSPDFEARR
jgi:predicted DNA-binding transcriptional regulator AlpA